MTDTDSIHFTFDIHTRYDSPAARWRTDWRVRVVANGREQIYAQQAPATPWHDAEFEVFMHEAWMAFRRTEVGT